MAINTFGSFPKSTPTQALEIIFDVMPLHIFCRQEGLAARIRLDDVVGLDWEGTNQRKTHSVSHLKYWESILQRYQISPKHGDRCSLMKWSDGYHVNKDSFSGDAKHRKPSQTNVYTDGSRQEERSGAGYTALTGKRVLFEGAHRLPDHATVFQAEITAIALSAEKLIHTSEPLPKFIKFQVDSQAALLALTNPLVKSKAVACAIDSLNKLTKTGAYVSLVWVPAHRGHEGNERADVLAKRGAASNDASTAITVGKPTATVKAEIEEKVRLDWATEWLDYKHAHHTKSFYLCPNKQKARYVYKLARLEAGRFVRIVTGHNNLGFFQHKLGLQTSDKCRLCTDGLETFTHLIGTCPALWRASKEFFGQSLPSNDMKWSVRSLLDFSYVKNVNEMFEGTWNNNDHGYEEDLLETTDSSDPDNAG